MKKLVNVILLLTADKAFKIETRTSDPSNSEPGQIWLRSDL